MSDATDHLDWLSAQLADAETAWSVGSFGAIAEFMRDAGEAISFQRTGGSISAITARGGLRIEAHDSAPGRLGIADDAKLEPPRRLVPAGRHLRDRPAHGPHRNRAGCGRAARARPLGGHVRSRAWNVAGQRLHSHRRCGRHRGAEKLDRPIAVRARQRRHGRDPGGQPASRVREPSRTRRSLSANTGGGRQKPRGPAHPCAAQAAAPQAHPRGNGDFFPAGFVPCAQLYPPHPARDAMGIRQPFRQKFPASFQELLARFGEVKLLDVKRRVLESVSARHGPSALSLPDGQVQPRCTPHCAAPDQNVRRARARHRRLACRARSRGCRRGRGGTPLHRLAAAAKESLSPCLKLQILRKEITMLSVRLRSPAVSMHLFCGH